VDGLKKKFNSRCVLSGCVPQDVNGSAPLSYISFVYPRPVSAVTVVPSAFALATWGRQRSISGGGTVHGRGTVPFRDVTICYPPS